MPLFPSPEPSVSCIDDLDFFKDFENEFPAIVYNDALTSKSDFLTKPTLCPQHIDEFDLKDETSLSEYDEVEQNVLRRSRLDQSFKDEDYALMACQQLNSDTEEEEQLSDASIEIMHILKSKKVEAQLVSHQQGQLDLKAKVEKWHNSSKNLSKLLNTQMSANDKFGLGYGDHIYDGILSYENKVLQSVFMNKESELENQPLYDRFVIANGMHVVPPPMTGNYMPSGPEIEVDYSQFTYGPKQTQPSESESQTSEFDTCESNISTEPSELVSEPVVNESNVSISWLFLLGHKSNAALVKVPYAISLKYILQALISLLTTITLSTTMAVLDSCPKHNMVAYLEKSEGNAEFQIKPKIQPEGSDQKLKRQAKPENHTPQSRDAKYLLKQRWQERNPQETMEGSATQATQTPTSTIFGDDETIAKVLLNMSQAKAVSREKEKGVELKDIEETDTPRPTSTRSLLTLKPPT
ncbi:hypothetical protein Tco_0152865 [Tanacetum coccineum]